MSSRGRAERLASLPGLTPRGAAFAVTAALSILFSYALDRTELLYLGCFLALFPILGAVLLVSTTPRITVLRRFEPESVEAHAAVTVTLEVRNSGPATMAECTWYDTVPDAVGARPLAALPPSGGRRSRETVRLRYELRPGRRGTFEIGPFAVVTQDPFGLVVRTVRADGMSVLAVTPRVTALPDVAFGRALSDGSATQLQRSGSLGDDDLITREYRPGDAKRRVHWRATARHGELMVRQEEPRSNPEAVVLLDTRPLSFPGARGIGLFDDGLHPVDDFERAIELGASVVLHLQRIGYGVDVLQTTTGRRSMIRPHDVFRGGGGTAAFLMRLAGLDVAVSTRDIDFATRLGGELHRFGAATPLFVVLGSLSRVDAERLAALRSMCEPAIAFVVTDDASSDEMAPLVAAGWTCIRVGTREDVARAWSSIADQIGVAE